MFGPTSWSVNWLARRENRPGLSFKTCFRRSRSGGRSRVPAFEQRQYCQWGPTHRVSVCWLPNRRSFRIELLICIPCRYNHWRRTSWTFESPKKCLPVITNYVHTLTYMHEDFDSSNICHRPMELKNVHVQRRGGISSLLLTANVRSSDSSPRSQRNEAYSYPCPT